MKKPIFLILLLLIITLNIILYRGENSIILQSIQLFIEVASLLSFFYLLWTLKKSTYLKWVPLITFGVFISLFRWWKAPFVIERFFAEYTPDFYIRYGQYLVIMLILIGGGFMLKNLRLANKSNL